MAKKPLSQTLYQAVERNSARLDDLLKWEVAKIANYSLQLEIKNNRENKDLVYNINNKLSSTMGFTNDCTRYNHSASRTL